MRGVIWEKGPLGVSEPGQVEGLGRRPAAGRDSCYSSRWELGTPSFEALTQLHGRRRLPGGAGRPVWGHHRRRLADAARPPPRRLRGHRRPRAPPEAPVFRWSRGRPSSAYSALPLAERRARRARAPSPWPKKASRPRRLDGGPRARGSGARMARLPGPRSGRPSVRTDDAARPARIDAFEQRWRGCSAARRWRGCGPPSSGSPKQQSQSKGHSAASRRPAGPCRQKSTSRHLGRPSAARGARLLAGPQVLLAAASGVGGRPRAPLFVLGFVGGGVALRFHVGFSAFGRFSAGVFFEILAKMSSDAWLLRALLARGSAASERQMVCLADDGCPRCTAAACTTPLLGFLFCAAPSSRVTSPSCVAQRTGLQTPYTVVCTTSLLARWNAAGVSTAAPYPCVQRAAPAW